MTVRTLPPRWTIDVESEESGETVVHLCGELTVREAADVRQVLTDVVATGPAALTIELGGVRLLDLAGLAAVSSSAMCARRAAIDVQIRPPQAPLARRVVDQVGILPILRSAVRRAEAAELARGTPR